MPESGPHTESVPDYSALGRRIRSLRKAAGYAALDEFAYDNGFSRAQYGRYEQGQNLTYKTLWRLSCAFNIPMSQLLDGLGPADGAPLHDQQNEDWSI